LLHNLGRAFDAAGRYKEAAAEYGKAASLNWAWSKNNLGVLTLYGRGVPQDLEQGIKLIRAAYEAGNEQAAINYESIDFSTLVNDDSKRTQILQSALINHGILSVGSEGIWSPQTMDAIRAFIKKIGGHDTGLSLHVIDQLGIAKQLSESF
jgi:TPR repeat protein